MTTFTIVYVSGDRNRTLSSSVSAVDIDAAAAVAIGDLEGRMFGVGSDWFVAAVVQADVLELVHATLEQEL